MLELSKRRDPRLEMEGACNGDPSVIGQNRAVTPMRAGHDATFPTKAGEDENRVPDSVLLLEEDRLGHENSISRFVLFRLEQVFLHRPERRTRPRRDADLRVDVLDVVVGGLR